jgi:salicylate hydroxylase
LIRAVCPFRSMPKSRRCGKTAIDSRCAYLQPSGYVARGHDGLREAYDRFLVTNFPLSARFEAIEDELGDVRAFRISAKEVHADNVVLHFHGGGYLIGSAKGSLEYASRLATAVDGVCYTVDYRLAPEHPYPAAIDDAVAAYRALLGRGIPASSILLSGESAGGGLAVALALALRTAGDPLPAGILAVAPFADLTLSGESVRAFNGDDPAANRDLLTFMGASYFQGHEPTDPLVSPLFGDLTGLPPLFVTATQGEVLLSDAMRLAERAERAGVDVTLRLVEDSVHVYTIFPFLPETESTMDEVADWARRNLQRSAAHSQAAETPVSVRPHTVAITRSTFSTTTIASSTRRTVGLPEALL